MLCEISVYGFFLKHIALFTCKSKIYFLNAQHHLTLTINHEFRIVWFSYFVVQPFSGVTVMVVSDIATSVQVIASKVCLLISNSIVASIGL